VRVYGKDITEEHTVLSFEELSDVPESKSNNVSFMKVEDLDPNCRNLLLTSDTYVCYSVTQKRNLLRAICTITGEKTILRGHEGPILDMHLSPIDHTIFCSVDNHSSTSAHIIVWKKNPDIFSFTKISQCYIPASIVQAHPGDVNTWCVAEGGTLGIMYSNASDNQERSNYNQLPIVFTYLNGLITGTIGGDTVYHRCISPAHTNST
jgi:hypothetical protein